MALEVCQAAATVPVEDNTSVEVFFLLRKEIEPVPSPMGHKEPLQPHLDPLIQFLYCKSNLWEDTGQIQTQKTLYFTASLYKYFIIFLLSSRATVPQES